MFRPSTLLVAALLVGMGGPSMFCEAQNVVGIDFGSEWIKIAVVQRSAGVSASLFCMPIIWLLPLRTILESVISGRGFSQMDLYPCLLKRTVLQAETKKIDESL